MASLLVVGDELHVQLSPWERVGALTNEFAVPLSSIVGVTRLGEARSAIRGWRIPGTGLPGLIALGRWRTRRTVDFVAVYRARPGYLIELADQEFDRIVISCDWLPMLDALS